MTFDQNEVGFLDLAVAEHVGEGVVSGVGFGNDEEAGGVFVQAVDDAGAVRMNRA